MNYNFTRLSIDVSLSEASYCISEIAVIRKYIEWVASNNYGSLKNDGSNNYCARETSMLMGG